MKDEINLEKYLSDGIDNMIRIIMKASFSNLKESLFLTRFALVIKKSKLLRQNAEIRGEHIPSFLIASITNACNLYCSGCYARANQSCKDRAEEQLLTEFWIRIFKEAGELGVNFILLAGGEPLMRPDVIKAAGKHKNILFPIFTNGTMLNEEYLELLDKKRNLIPVVSLEGNETTTDGRRGSGVYHNVIRVIDRLNSKGILYGASITFTKENLEEVTSKDFLERLYQDQCRFIIYVEYVPVDISTKQITPEEEEYAEDDSTTFKVDEDGELIEEHPEEEEENEAGANGYNENGADEGEEGQNSDEDDEEKK